MATIDTIHGPMDEGLLEHRQIVTESDDATVVRDEWHFEGVEVRSNLWITMKRGIAADALAGIFA